MTIKYKNPYGDYSFETFNKENAAFVDKTGFIEVINFNWKIMGQWILF